MSYDTNMTNNDEYDVTAVQIFDLCGVEGCGAIRVDALMDKFAPFVKTDKAEFTYLRTLLDPEQCNPEINVTKLATALHKYSEKKTKVDLDESFNVRGGQMPLDSDSGISSDGLQLMEELQCELKEKEHLYNQLRRRLDSAERQHEEAMAALSAERDSLQTHVNVIRDENAQLSQVRHEYEEVCERLCAVEAAMTTHARANDTLKRRNNLLTEQIAGLEADKLTLQELLSKSKDECHRINEMYATRQSALLEENETLRSSHGEVSSRLQDHEEFMHQLIKEKAQLEMELKDLLNKSNQTHLRLDRSIDVSYTDDQMLTALDSLNADSRFIPEQGLLDEESFLNALRDEPGRATNVSLFDELRHSFINKSRLSAFTANFDNMLDNSLVNCATQTEDENKHCAEDELQNDLSAIKVPIETQTSFDFELFGKGLVKEFKTIDTQTYFKRNKVDITVLKESYTIETQTELQNRSYAQVDKAQNTENNNKTKGTQTIGGLFRNRPKPSIPKKIMNIVKKEKNFNTEGTQTDDIDPYPNNNNVHNSPCLECNKLTNHNLNLEKDFKYSELLLSEMEDKISHYEDNLNFLQNIIDEGKDKNKTFESVIEKLRSKMEMLEKACEKQNDVIVNLMSTETECVACQTEIDQTSVGTQVETPCGECDKRKMSAPQRMRRLLWEPLKSLLQLFAVVCFVCACCVVCGLARARGCARRLPWGWLHAQDVLDLLLRVEYTSDVPM